MPSLTVTTETAQYLASHSVEQTDQHIDRQELGQTDPQLPDLDPDSDVVTNLREEMWNKFMEQSMVINNTDGGNKVLKCFHEYVIAAMESAEFGPDDKACPVKFDGVSCWPETPPGTLRAIPCFHDFNGVYYDPSENNATLYCYPNGTWSKISFYNACLNALTHAPENSEGSTVTTSTTIFYVGNSLSLIAVTLALWIFISFKDLRCLRNTIHINLLFTYLLHNLFWIIYASLQTMVNEMVGCSFYVALNYFTLTNFMWMFVEGLYLYVLVVKTFSVENIRLRVYTIIGWGVPIPIILLWVILKSNLTSNQNHREGSMQEVMGLEGPEMEGMLQNCPLMPDSPIDWIHKSPVIFLLSSNLIFLTRIMWVLITKLRSANTVETQRYRKATKALLVLIPLLGLTYMLLIALPKELEHIQAILLSTQGFWVAVFYCFLNSEVQNSIRHHIERWKTERGFTDPRRPSLRNTRDESPRPRGGGRSYGRRLFGGKRESLCSEVTTMTTYVTNGYNPVSTHPPSGPPPSGGPPLSGGPPPTTTTTPAGQNASSIPMTQCNCRNNSTAGLNACCDDGKILIRDSVI